MYKRVHDQKIYKPSAKRGKNFVVVLPVAAKYTVAMYEYMQSNVDVCCVCRTSNTD